MRIPTVKSRGVAPAAWTPCAAVADSIQGGAVNVAQQIAGATLTANDTVDSRGTLQVQSLSNRIGCTAVLDVNAQTIAFTPTQTSPVSFDYTIIDTQAFTSTATVTFPTIGASPPPPPPPPPGPPPPGPPPPGSFAQKWYGNPFCGPFTGLGNTVTSGSRLLAQPFLANYTGNITGIKCYYIWAVSGYAAGTGGTYRCRLVKTRVSDGRPDMTQILGTSNSFTQSSAGTFPDVVFPTPVPVVAGQIYAIVHYNVDASPGSNYASPDDMNTDWDTRTNTSTGADLNYAPTPITPFIPDLQHRTVYSDDGGSTWTVRPRTPILQINYQDGSRCGCGYDNAGGAHSNDGLSGDNNMVGCTASTWAREVWTQDRTITATQVGVCVTISTASGFNGNSPLTIRILQGPTLLQSVSVSASSCKNAPQAPAQDGYATPLAFAGKNADRRWQLVPLSPNLTLSAGTQYILELRGAADTKYLIGASHRGSGFTVGKDVTWGGTAQYSTNSGGTWSNWIHQGSATTVMDLPAAFVTT